MDNIVKERIIELLRENQISVSQLSKEIGIPQNTLNRQINGETSVAISTVIAIIGYFKNISSDWLLGISDNRENRQPMHILNESKATEKILNEQEVLLYDVSAAANLKTLFDNKRQNILGKISIPDMPRCDGAVYVTGDSMYPLLKSGDIIVYKELRDFQNVIFGEMYLVSFDLDGDDFLTVKYVNHSEKGDDFVKLVSYNTYHDPKHIPINSIRAMALIKLSIRKNTMN